MDSIYSVTVDNDGSIFMGGQMNSSNFVVIKIETDLSYSVWTVCPSSWLVTSCHTAF